MNEANKDLSVTPPAPRYQRPMSHWERAGLSAKESRARKMSALAGPDRANQNSPGASAQQR